MKFKNEINTYLFFCKKHADYFLTHYTGNKITLKKLICSVENCNDLAIFTGQIFIKNIKEVIINE